METCEGVADTAVLAALFADLVRHYEENGRYYHNLQHIYHMFTVADSLAYPIVDPVTFELALWYHDVIYNPRALDNEQQSARYVAGVLPQLGITTGQIERIQQMILATAHGAGETAVFDSDTCYLLDLDLAILGAEPMTYNRYSQAIRREYAHIPDALYRQGRAAILQQFLQRPHIYHTEPMRQLYEAHARQNLQRELHELLQSSDHYD